MLRVGKQHEGRLMRKTMIIAALMMTTPVFADVVHLNDGTTVTGELNSEI